MKFDNDYDVSYFESINSDIKFNYFDYDFSGMRYAIKSSWFKGQNSRMMLNEANKRLRIFIASVNDGDIETPKETTSILFEYC